MKKIKVILFIALLTFPIFYGGTHQTYIIHYENKVRVYMDADWVILDGSTTYFYLEGKLSLSLPTESYMYIERCEAKLKFQLRPIFWIG